MLDPLYYSAINSVQIQLSGSCWAPQCGRGWPVSSTGLGLTPGEPRSTPSGTRSGQQRGPSPSCPRETALKVILLHYFITLVSWEGRKSGVNFFLLSTYIVLGECSNFFSMKQNEEWEFSFARLSPQCWLVTKQEKDSLHMKYWVYYKKDSIQISNVPVTPISCPVI